MAQPPARTVDTGTDELLLEIESNVATLTFNRPQARNALSDTLSPALRDILPTLADDPEVRSLLITGAGAAFCAGGDVKGMGSNATPQRQRTRAEAIDDLTTRQLRMTGALHRFPKPTLAALPGPAVGAGLSIALACDLRIAARSAFLMTGFKNVGLSGDYGASYFLTHLVGTSKARELFYGSERIPAERCLELGIVNRVTDDETLREQATAWARELAAGPTAIYRLMKQNLERALHEDLETCLAHEAAAIVESAQTHDHREAVRAFIEKRKPSFEGR